MYDANLNQLTEGQRLLYETHQIIPRIGWMIDPFGISSLTPSHWANIGFNALVISRIPYAQKYQRQQNKTMEFIWRGSKNFQSDSDMFTHLLDQQAYENPKGYWFDAGDPPVNSRNLEKLTQT